MGETRKKSATFYDKHVRHKRKDQKKENLKQSNNRVWYLLRF